MKARPCFLPLLPILLFFSPFLIYSQQEDFYGTWVGKTIEDFDDEYYEIVIITIAISAISFIETWEWFNDDTLIDYEEYNDARIIKWTAVTNTDRTTRTNFPLGYSILLTGTDWDDIPLEIFISGDKRRIIIPEINELYDNIIVLRKQ